MYSIMHSSYHYPSSVLCLITQCALLGSAGRREEETSDELEFYNSHISPVLEQMNAASTGTNISMCC